MNDAHNLVIQNIKRLSGYIENVKINDLNELNKEDNQNQNNYSSKKTDKETKKRDVSIRNNEDINCCDACFITSPLFLVISLLMCAISVILFLYLINITYQVTNPEGVEVNQENAMFFDYLVTDIFTIHNNFLSTHNRSYNIVFNTPYGVKFNNMSVEPDGTITATNCNFTELNFPKIKIRRSTILSVTPQNDEIIFDMPTIDIDKSINAMELDCSGFIIKNGKLFDSTGTELTWPSPGDSRYSFLTSSNNINPKNQIFRVYTKSSILNSQDLRNTNSINFSNEVSNYYNYANSGISIYSNNKKKVKEIKDNNEFNYKCKNITASYNSFACISTQNDFGMIYFAHCLDSKCNKTEKNIINYFDYSETSKIDKMLIFDDDFIAILLKNHIYIFDRKGNINDRISNVDDIIVIDDGMHRYLLYLQNNNLIKYKSELILSFRVKNECSSSIKTFNDFSIGIFKSKLILFSNQKIEIKSNEQIIMFDNKNNVSQFIVDKNGIVYAFDYDNNLLTCDIKSLKCNKLIKFNYSNDIQILPMKRGGFVAISLNKDKKVLHHFFGKQNFNIPKVITANTYETADEIIFTTSGVRYPRIFSITNGIVTVNQCTNSKCHPSFAN